MQCPYCLKIVPDYLIHSETCETTERMGNQMVDKAADELEKCKECFHDKHKVGECKNCNCGSSEIIYSKEAIKDPDFWKDPENDFRELIKDYV